MRRRAKPPDRPDLASVVVVLGKQRTRVGHAEENCLARRRAQRADAVERDALELDARLVAMRQPEAGQARAGGSEYLDPLLPVRRVTDDEQALRVDVEPERLKDAAWLSADLH